MTTAMSNMRYQGEDCAKEVKKGNISSFFKKPKAGQRPDTCLADATKPQLSSQGVLRCCRAVAECLYEAHS